MADDLLQLDARISAVRDLVNDDRRRASLSREPRRWNQLCSCMDAVGDAEHALDGHADLEDGQEHRHLYLAHFGFVQALFLQQDAVAHLCKTLGFDDLADCVRAELSDVRELRNDVAHMTDREYGRRFVGIVRTSMTERSFERYSFGDLDVDHATIDCCEVQRRQRAVLGEVLDQVLDRLREEEREHRERFRGEPLADAFRGTSYAIEKLAAGARHADDPRDVAVAIGSLGVLDRAVDTFAAALARRGIVPGVNSWVDRDVATAREALGRMRQLLSNREETIDAEAMVLLVERQLLRLEETARSYDETYAEDPLS